MARPKKPNPVGVAQLCSPTGIIRHMTFYRTQERDVVGTGENASYNEAGATAYMKHQKALWEQSDQFVGIPLHVEIGD